MIQSKQIQKPQKILVVDDQEINRDVLGVILEDRYEVIYAADGMEALDVINENADSISLVMLDLFYIIKISFFRRLPNALQDDRRKVFYKIRKKGEKKIAKTERKEYNVV